MAPRDELNIPLGMDNKNALRSLRGFERAASSTANNVKRGFDDLRKVAAIAVGYIGARQIIRGIEAVTTAASVQEDAVNNLNAAMKAAGDFSQQAASDFQTFASSIQSITRYGDEAVLQQLALAKAFGASNDQAKLVVGAAVELAAATGKSLDEATRQVSKTLGGFAGELGEVNPRIKELSKEQLQAGEAAKVLLDQYKGQAAAAAETFSGKTDQLKNAFSDLNEEIGFAIIKSPSLNSAMGLLTDTLRDMIGWVHKNRQAFEQYLSAAIERLKVEVPEAVRGAKALAEAMRILAEVSPIGMIAKLISNVTGAFEENTSIINKATRAYLLLIESILNLYKVAAIVPDSIAQIFGKDLTEAVGLDAAADAVKRLREQLEKPIKPGPNTGTILTGGATGAEAISQQAGAAGVGKPTVGGLATSGEEQGGKPGGTFGVFGSDMFAFPTAPNMTDNDKKQAAIIGEMIASAMKDGLEGGKKAAAQGLAMVGDAFIPGIGSALGPIFEAAQQDPEVLRESIRQFVQGFVEGVPMIIDGLVAASDEIIESLIDSLLVRGGLERIVVALLRAVPRIAAQLVESTYDGLLNAFKALGQSFADVVRGKTKFEIPDWVNKLKIETPTWLSELDVKSPAWLDKLYIPEPDWLDKLEIKAPGSGGSATGATDWVKDRLGIPGATGGIVPPGYPNDTFQSRLTSGEMVTPPRTTESLFRLIDSLAASTGSGSSKAVDGSSRIEMLLTKILNTLSQPTTVESKIEIGYEKLADVILQLQRQNARISA